jgi:hypothetical protein
MYSEKFQNKFVDQCCIPLCWSYDAMHVCISYFPWHIHQQPNRLFTVESLHICDAQCMQAWDLWYAGWVGGRNWEWRRKSLRKLMKCHEKLYLVKGVIKWGKEKGSETEKAISYSFPKKKSEPEISVVWCSSGHFLREISSRVPQVCLSISAVFRS